MPEWTCCWWRIGRDRTSSCRDVFPPEDTDSLADICYTSDKVHLLVGVRERENHVYGRLGRLAGTAVSQTSGAAISARLALSVLGARFPDAHAVCAHLVHPQAEAVSTFGGHSRDAVLAFCNLGHDAVKGRDAAPERGWCCWRRVVKTATVDPTKKPKQQLTQSWAAPA
jgi:hypothetical protein